LETAQEHPPASGASGGTASAATRLRYFGDYELLEEIARGGMGVLFKARQVSLNRLVALKLISAGTLATPELVKRFKAEAEAAASLAHTNVVPIYEIGEHEGQHYFSMGLIEGPNLREALARQSNRSSVSSGQSERNPERWPLSSWVKLVSTIARAVHYAHQRGVLHRDIKPSNILLNSAGEPHLTDFGLAKLVQKESTLTHTNAVMGTPAYMSPEQARGETKDVTTAADVYGLGAALYETLTGSPPFAGGTSLETIRQVLEKEPRRPSIFNPKVDRDLETICLKCLEKEPNRRYSSAEAFANDLDHWLRSEPIAARPAGNYERVKKWVRRRPAIAGLGALSLVSLLALAIGSPIAALRIASAKHAEGEERKIAVRAKNQAVGAANELRRTLYASEMNIAYQTWQSGDTERARTFLARQRPPPGEADLRGWEWRYLWGQSRLKELKRLTTASTYGFWSCAFSPDGQLAAGGTVDGQVVLWDPRTGRTVAEVGEPGRLDTVDSLAFTRDGSSLFQSLRHSCEVVVRELPAGHSRLRFGPKIPFSGLRFALSPDETLVATAHGPDYVPAGPGDLRLWDARSGQELGARTPPQSSLVRVAFAPDGKHVGTSGARGHTKVWSVPDLREVAVLAHDEQRIVFALAFSPDGRRLVTGTSDGLLRIWEWESQRLVATWLGHSLSCDAAIWSADGKLLATGGRDEIVRLWNPTNQTEVAVLKGHAGRVSALAFSPDGQLLVSASQDKTLRSWQVAAELARARAEFARGWRASNVHSELAISPDNRWLALHSQNNAIDLLSLTNLQTVVTLAGNRPAFSVDSRWLVTILTNQLHLFSIPDGRRQRTFEAQEELDGNLTFAPDSTRFAMATTAGGIVIWSVTNSAPLLRVDATNRLEALFFTPTGREVVALHGANGTLEWFDTATGNRTRALVTGKGSVLSAALSADGKWVLIGETAVRMRLVELASGRVELVPGDMGSVVCVAWSADGQTIAAGTFEGFIKLWNTRTRREVAMLRGHTSFVTALEFSRDGRHLVSGSFDNTWRLWSAPSMTETDAPANQ
jgi:eukaryotic-like serine/threonine-protein kinase